MPIYDAILVVSFGGPDGPDDVIPFLENVLRGRNVPRERMLEVAEHYYHFGGKSPINEQNRALDRGASARAGRARAAAADLLGQPQLASAAGRHAAANGGRRRAARAGVRHQRVQLLLRLPAVSRGHRRAPSRRSDRRPPQVDKLRVFFNHPGFIEPMIERTRRRLRANSGRAPRRRACCSPPTASRRRWPTAAATKSSSARRAGLVGESASGPRRLGNSSTKAAAARRSSRGSSRISATSSGVNRSSGLIPRRRRRADRLSSPITWKCSTIWTPRRGNCATSLGINMVRAATVGTHPRFVRMIRELIEERMTDSPQRLALGTLGPKEDVCPDDCCVYTPRAS